uniref:Uncharacterized protein n=1 Tax=Triticum urartu TaxID=4572 RepID=A0A8R7JWC3_TRIUA
PMKYILCTRPCDSSALLVSKTCNNSKTSISIRHVRFLNNNNNKKQPSNGI